MRFFIAILAGWLIYIPLLLVLNLLFFFLSGSFAQFNELPKEEIAREISRNSWSGVKIGLTVLGSVLTSNIISPFVAGLIAGKKGVTIGLIVSSILPFIGLTASLVKGYYNFNFTGLILITVILFTGAFAGFLGEKFYTKFMLKTK